MVKNAVRTSVRARDTRVYPASTGAVESCPHRSLASKEGQVLSQHVVCAAVSCSAATCRACGCCPGRYCCVYNQGSRFFMLGMWGGDSPPCRVHVLNACVWRVQEGGSPVGSLLAVAASLGTQVVYGQAGARRCSQPTITPSRGKQAQLVCVRDFHLARLQHR